MTPFCDHHPKALCALCRPLHKGALYGETVTETLRYALDVLRATESYTKDYFTNAPEWYREMM